jgi:hypothetical protein
MSVRKESSAVTVACSHVEAWSHHDWDKARERLAPDVHGLQRPHNRPYVLRI